MRIMSTAVHSLGIIFSCFVFAGSESSETQAEEFSLGDDVTFEILSRLPVKSLLRFNCVCKSWQEIIQEKKFVEKHMHKNDDIHEYEYKNQELETISSDDALVLERSRLTNKYRLRNPSTRKILDLPHLKVSDSCLALDFVYLPMINNCKLIHIFRKEKTRNVGCEILIPGVDITWRIVDNPSFYNLVNEDGFDIKFAVVKDVYFMASFFLTAGSRICHKLVYLELGSESSGDLEMPQNFFSNWGTVELVTWKNCMLSISSLVDGELHIWILENYKTEKWADQKIIISLAFISKYPIDPEVLYPICVNNDNWLWFNLSPEFDLGYNIQSKEVYFKTPPPGKRFSCSYLPNLLSLPGFQLDPNQNRNTNG